MIRMSIRLVAYDHKAPILTPSVPLDDWAAASRAVRAYVEEYGLAARDWKGGEVTADDGEELAIVSWNGKVWDRCTTTPPILLYSPPEVAPAAGERRPYRREKK